MDRGELKTALRAGMKQRWSEWKSLGGPVSEAEIARRIGDALEALPSFRSAPAVLLYASVPGEVPTWDWIGKWRREKRIVLPKVEGDDLVLKEYVPELMARGRFGIMEPSGDAPCVDTAEIGLAVVPGVAFDSEGRRLGHGCGYYDRLLRNLACPKVGVAFPFRMVEEVPVDDGDVNMDMVIW